MTKNFFPATFRGLLLDVGSGRTLVAGAAVLSAVLLTTAVFVAATSSKGEFAPRVGEI